MMPLPAGSSLIACIATARAITNTWSSFQPDIHRITLSSRSGTGS